jgi:signal transduction histidine kinase/DNA-binding response OmpR family regulator
MLKFRTKLLLLVGGFGLSLLLLIALDALTAEQEEAELERMEARYLPLLELAPETNALMERLRRAFQDAAAAADDSQLTQAQEAHDRLIARLEQARSVLPQAEVSVVEIRIDRYYDAALSITRRMIAGETGEALLDGLSTMQLRQKQAFESLAKTTSFDRTRFGRAFDSLRHARTQAASLRIAVGAGCLLLCLLLSAWIGRRTLGALDELAFGFARFGNNKLTEPIRVLSNDEVGEVARRANQMAERLHELIGQRERSAWLARGQADFSLAIAGELSPSELGARACQFLASYLGAPAAALYSVEAGRVVTCLASHGADERPADEVVEKRGLLRAACQGNQIQRVSDLPADYLRIGSALGSSAARAVWMAPVSHLGQVIAVIELGLLGREHADTEALLATACSTLAIALHASWTRISKQKLLQEAQDLTAQLTAQEEELRAINDELSAQQEELRAANEELTQQTEALEQQRRTVSERNLELELSRERLQHQTIQLETANRYKTQFLANMSHELRTPLNSMLLLSELLSRNEQKNLTDKQVEFAATVHAAGKDLLNLINQLLDLAKIEAGKLDVNPSEISVRELMLHLTRIYTPLASGKGLELAVQWASDVPETIISDRSRIEQVLTNLIGNSIKFTEHGRVSIMISLARAEGRAPMLQFAVRDTGIGIAQQDLSRIFSAFEQVDGGSQRKHGGTGLGLAIARQLSHLLGGDLSVESEPGKGSCFTLSISTHLEQEPGEPTVDGAEQGRAKPSRIAIPESVTRPAPVIGDADSLLIIEDDLVFAERMAELVNECGFNALLAKDGESGLRLARVHRPRGIVLDMRLPDSDGMQVLEKLKESPDCRHIPVHFVSCVDDEARARSLGAIGYLRKPASHDDLKRVIERLAPATLRRVLVVEDDQKLGDSLVSLLSEQGVEASRASSGQAALTELRSGSYSCMILDLGLPDVDGLDILERLEKDDTLPKLPVVVHTGRSLSRKEVQQLEAYTESIVLKGQGSPERVLEEVRLFVDRLGRGKREEHATRPIVRDTKLEGKKVLVADDDMRTVYALSALLRGKGMNVLVADTGRSAVNMLEADNDVDAVIMDIMMPEMDGYEAMREIRKDERFRSLPIIALTAKAMKDDRVRCIEAGASDYMPKPIDGNRLLSVLHAWLATG